MRVKLWVKLASTLFAVILCVLFSVYMIKDHGMVKAAWSAALWSLVSTSVFVATRLYHSSKGRRCELCNDMPAQEVQKTTHEANIIAE